MKWEVLLRKDNVDGDITHKIIVTGKVNTSVAGTYELVYEVTDAAGNKAQVTREIIVETKSAADLNSQDTNKSEGSNNHVSTTPNADIKSQSSVKTSDKSNIKTPLLFTVFLFSNWRRVCNRNKKKKIVAIIKYLYFILFEFVL